MSSFIVLLVSTRCSVVVVCEFNTRLLRNTHGAQPLLNKSGGVAVITSHVSLRYLANLQKGLAITAYNNRDPMPLSTLHITFHGL